MQLNNMMAKGFKATHDETLINYMHKQIANLLQNESLCFIEPEETRYQDEYKIKLRKQ